MCGQKWSGVTKFRLCTPNSIRPSARQWNSSAETDWPFPCALEICQFWQKKQWQAQPEGAEGGPYGLKLSSQDNRLAFDITGPDFSRTHVLSLTPMKTVIRDYGLICESYYEALRGSSPSQIESVDMGRRGLHNEGAEQLAARLDGKIVVDHETARRLFTLLCALYRRG